MLKREESDGAMLLDESGDGIPADAEVIINYEDDNGKKYEDSVSLNPDLWVSTTFSSKEERVKLFVCGAGFIGICRSGRGRPRPFG